MTSALGKAALTAGGVAAQRNAAEELLEGSALALARQAMLYRTTSEATQSGVHAVSGNAMELIDGFARAALAAAQCIQR